MVPCISSINISAWEKKKPKLVFGFFPCFVGGKWEGRYFLGVSFLVEGYVGGFGGFFLFYFQKYAKNVSLKTCIQKTMVSLFLLLLCLLYGLEAIL